MDQIKIFQNYLKAYRANELPKDMFFFYLELHEKTFNLWMDIMSDPATVHFEDDVIHTRLANIPVGFIILADRGFAYDAFKYPNFNPHITPHFKNKRPQFPQEESEEDLTACKLRYGSETNFARVVRHSSLQDVVPFEYFSILQHIVDCAYGDANFCQPFYDPENYIGSRT